ncbi:MAG: glycerol-3-phosphate dehydrogenase/oxidase [Deltaproteobacteria bacterium]|nr:glycerol-3-phosphate dehydrogenase/oxidase [Deltaproteobacteria bacterium]
MEVDTFDIIVIGGGINGTGVARDAAMRGYRVLLLEKQDISSGATGACSGMIHGGIRYLMHDRSVTKMSCIDSGHIQKIARHMIFRIPFIMPVLKSDPNAKIYFELAEVYFSAYDRYQPLKNGLPHARLNSETLKEIIPMITDEAIGAVTTDEWGIDPFRLSIENAKSAELYGAKIKLGYEVIDFIIEDKCIKGVITLNKHTGRREMFYSKLVANLTGPWSDKLTKNISKANKVRPSRGVHIVFDRKYINFAVIAKAVDGRQVFICPHQNGMILGTTDDDYYGDLDRPYATLDDVEYLYEAMERVIPDIRKFRAIRTMTGVRPTIYEYNKYEDDLTRDHKIIDHEKTDNIKGLISMIGGKLAAYRLMSEEFVDLIDKKFAKRNECRTMKEPLLGERESYSLEECYTIYPLKRDILARLIYRYGCQARDILKKIKDEPVLSETVCHCEGVTRAEIEYAIEKEWAYELMHIRRRTRLGTGPCQGMRCSFRAAQILAENLNLHPSAAKDIFIEFIERRWGGRRFTINERQIKSEELFFRNVLNLWK